MRIAGSLAPTVVLVVLATAASAEDLPYLFEPAPLPGDASIAVVDVSGDGSRAVCSSSRPQSVGPTPAFCDPFGPTTAIDIGIFGAPTAISSDGSAVLVRAGSGLALGVPGLWTEAGGLLLLPNLENATLPAGASALSADGSTVVGNVWMETGGGGTLLAARWDDGVLSLFTPDGHPEGMPGPLMDLSETGLVLGFSVVSDLGLGFVSDGTTIEPILEVAGQLDRCIGYAISADGTAWVGFCRLNGTESVVPVRWRDGDEQSLQLLTEAFAGVATDVSADGSVVVGAAFDGPAWRPFVWTDVDGFRLLEDRLEGAGVDTSGVPLDAIYDVNTSADGRTVVGGTFIARIPEPQPVPEASATLACVAALVALTRVRVWRASR